MHLATLSTHIPPKIYNRGVNYYYEGAIDAVSVIGDRVEASVQGSELYEVHLMRSIDDPDEILEWSCDCPYDMGDICKHVVAVMIYLKELEEIVFEEAKPEEEGIDKTEIESNQTTNMKDNSDPIDRLLNNIPPAELRQFLKKSIDSDPKLARLFEATFSQYAPTSTSNSKAKGIIGKLIRSYQARGQYGFIDRRASSALGIELVQLLESKKHQQASDLHLFAIEAIDKGVASYEKGNDDSNGHFGDALRFALNILEDIAAGTTLDNKERKKLFDRVLKLWLSGVPAGYAVELDDLLISLANTDAMNALMMQRVEEQIAQIEGDDWSANYDRQKFQMIQYQLISRIEGADAGKVFLYNHLDSAKFRKEALRLAEEAGDWPEVKKLAEEGIVLNSDDSRGLMGEWRDWLIKWAEATGDSEMELRLLEESFLQAPTMAEYHLLKKKMPPELFAPKLEKWIAEHHEDPYTRLESIFSEIAIEEERWDDLYKYLVRSYEFYDLNRYETIIPDSYREDIVALYSVKLNDYIDANTGRDKYKVAARQLVRMVRLGGLDQAKFVAEEAMKRHPRRPSMKEEFEKVMKKWR